MMMAPTETMSGVSIFGISPLESFVLLLSAPGNKMFVHEKKIMMKHQIQVHFSSVNAQKNCEKGVTAKLGIRKIRYRQGFKHVYFE